MSTTSAQLLKQWHGNPRLQLGVGIILVILLINIGLVLHDHRRGLETAHARSAGQLSRLQALAKQQDWGDRADKAQSYRKRWRKLLWAAQTPGLAQATIDELIRNALQAADAQGIQVNIAAANKMPDLVDVWEIQATVEGLFSRPGLLSLLRELETQARATEIIQLKARETNSSKLFVNVVVSGYFSLSADDMADPTESEREG